MTTDAIREKSLAVRKVSAKFACMAPLPLAAANVVCAHCELPITIGAAHYQINWELRRLIGVTIHREQSQTTLRLCARCSLGFDLTRLDIPSKDGWYSFEPLGYVLTDDNVCGLCQKEFVDGERFEATLIRPLGFAEESDEPKVVVVLCQCCTTQRALRYAEPPSNAVPPYCYQCGTYTGYNGGMSDQRKFYVAHPSITGHRLFSERVRVCPACFFKEPSD